MKPDVMGEELTASLIAKAHADQKLWDLLKDREMSLEQRGEQERPNIIQLIKGFLDEQCGSENRFSLGDLIIQLRREVRRDLNLPV
jgi:hypothetical protein